MLKSIAISGVPVDDIPCIDIWSTQTKIYSSVHEEDDGDKDYSNDQHWDDEEGFYKINAKVLGDFVILCRFGGEYKHDVNDPTKVLFRYANSTGFMCQGAYELQKDKVDMMKRYAASFDAEDFKVVLLFDVVDCDPSYESFQIPDCLPNVCSEREAFDVGWSSISKHHCLIPSSVACEVLTEKGYPVELATVALQLGNNDVQKALELLNETLGELSERLGYSKGPTSPPLRLRKSSSEGTLSTYVDACDIRSSNYSKTNTEDNEDESDRFMNALSELNFGFNIDTDSSSTSNDFPGISANADMNLDTSLIGLSSSVVPRGQEISDAAKNSQQQQPQSFDSPRRRATISSMVPHSASSPTSNEDSTHMLEEDEEFVDARNFATPDAQKRRKKKSSEQSHKEKARGQSHNRKKSVQSDDTSDEAESLPVSEKEDAMESSALDNETRDMLLQLKRAGISLEELIKLKQGNLPWQEIERRGSSKPDESSENKRDGIGTGTGTGSDEEKMQDGEAPNSVKAGQKRAAAALEAMFAKRSQDEEDPPPPPQNKSSALVGGDEVSEGTNEKPSNPADIMKAMFAKRQALAGGSDKPSEAEANKPSNPADAMKAMLAKRQAGAEAEAEAEADKPSNPADMMKAMFAKRQALAGGSDKPSEDEADKPSNPADVMKAMFAKRQASLPDPGAKISSPSPLPQQQSTAQQGSSTPSGEGTRKRIPLKEMEEFAKYFKMLKAGLPKEVVKHSMKRDGKDPDVLDNDPNLPLPVVVPLNQDPKFSKYFKMLKMNIPLGAVKQAMRKAGLDPCIIHCDPNKPLPKELPKPKRKPINKNAPKLKDDPKFTKYFKMLKMGLPMGAVMQSLAKDGLDPKIIEMDHDKSLDQNLAERNGAKDGVSAADEKPKVPKRRRKKLDWKPIEKNKVDKDSIWGEGERPRLCERAGSVALAFLLRTCKNLIPIFSF